ncbi:MAG: hypothetical protein E7337_13905 [Clostridiales bacterium]|nr:hypothetical protein [Clostridiales bacterium]
MKRVTPVKIFTLYWAFCLLLYAFGPFKWVTYKPVLFWSLNILYYVFFCLGWVSAGKFSFGGYRTWTDRNDRRLVKQLGFLVYVNLFYEIINIFRTFLFASFDVGGLVNRISSGISNMGDSYNSFQDNVNATSAGVVGGSLITLFNYVWDIWAFSTLIFSVMYFKKLKKHQKIIAGITIVLEIIAYLARGTNIGIFRIIMIILVIYYLKYMGGTGKKKKNTKDNKKNRIRIIVLGSLGVVIMVIIFFIIMKSRGGIAFWKQNFYNIGGIHINRDSVFFKIIPSGFHQLLVSLSGYLSQGFYGMSLSLRLPWVPHWGIGGSMALQNLLGNFIPTISERTYQVRIERFGWDSYTQWHTMYTWIANDLSFFGVMLYMGLFGYVFRRALRDSIELNNPYAKLMVYFMFLKAVFLPCNHQLAQTTYVMFSFIYVFIMWQISKRTSIRLTI